MTQVIRIADDNQRHTFRLTPQFATFQRLCIASASDEGQAAADLGLPPAANHYCLGSPEWKAWRDAYTRTLLDAGKLDVAEREFDASEPQPVGPIMRLWIRVRNYLYGENN